MKAIDEHTKKLVELSEDYKELFFSIFNYDNLTKVAINYFIEDNPNRTKLMQIANNLDAYFTNLKSLNLLTLSQTVEPFNDHLQNIVLERFKKIYDISKKYNINDIDELLDQIVELWNKKHINNDTFKLNVIRTLSFFTAHSEVREFASKSFSQVYLDMVDDDILDPMQPIGTSNEPLYIMMPVSPEFYDANFKVLSHKINWQLMCNGGVPLRYFCGGGYRFEVIMYSLKRDCCMFDDVFQFHQHSEPKALHFTNYSEFIRMSGNDDELIQRFKDYLTIPEVFNHQLELYKGHENPIGDAEIAELKPLVDSQNAKTY